MTADEQRSPVDDDGAESTGKLPLLWSPDGHNWLPLTWRGWLVVAAGALVIGVIVAWLS